jgi:hypothetical protein
LPSVEMNKVGGAEVALSTHGFLFQREDREFPKVDTSIQLHTRREICVKMEYRLDLNTLLMMLRQSTGSLYAEIQHLPGIKGHCQVFLRLERGSIQSCSIFNEQGFEASSGEAAIKLIQNHVLEWHYTEEKPPTQILPQISPYGSREAPPRQPFPLAVRSPIPHRTYSFIPHNNFLTWPRLYRSVYSLIDGKTSIDNIVRMLVHEQRKERVLEVIAHLQRDGLIVFDKTTGKI